MNLNEVVKKLREIDIEKEQLYSMCKFTHPLPNSHYLIIKLSEKKLNERRCGKALFDIEIVRYSQCLPGGNETVPIIDLDQNNLKRVLKIIKEFEEWADGKKENPPKTTSGQKCRC